MNDLYYFYPTIKERDVHCVLIISKRDRLGQHTKNCYNLNELVKRAFICEAEASLCFSGKLKKSIQIAPSDPHSYSCEIGLCPNVTLK